MEEDPEIIKSPLCQTITEKGHTIEVEIYQAEDGNWILEVVDEANSSLVWDDRFPTDQAAFDELLNAIKEDGIESLVSTNDKSEQAK